jgi:hypothetical protein
MKTRHGSEILKLYNSSALMVAVGRRRLPWSVGEWFSYLLPAYITCQVSAVQKNSSMRSPAFCLRRPT